MEMVGGTRYRYRASAEVAANNGGDTGGQWLIGPMVYTKTYIITYFHSEYLVLFVMVRRNSKYLVVLIEN